MNDGINNNSKLPLYTAGKTFKPQTIGAGLQFAQELFNYFGAASPQLNEKYYEIGPEFGDKPLTPETADELLVHQPFLD